MKYAVASICWPLLLAPVSAQAAEWTVDQAASKIGFSGTQTGTPFSGRFKAFEVHIDFDQARPETGHVLAVIDMASAETGDIQRDEALPQADWFDAAAHKQAVFEAKTFVATGPNSYNAPGILTIRGISKAVILPFKLTIADGRAHATGHLDLIRTAFGVGQGDWASGQWVALEVGADIDVFARQ